MRDGISFNSKIDLWILIVLLLAVAALAFGAIIVFRSSAGAGLIAGVLLSIAAALPLWLVISTRYHLSDRELRVRSGPFRWTVPIAEITSVTPTRSPLSSPALSLDRLRIEYGAGRAIMISPEPRHDFLRQLEARRK